jgi:hypothetical protein
VSSFRALIDTNVLYRPLARDLIVRCALAGVFRALWTDDILRELRETRIARGVRGDHDRLEHQLRTALPDACVPGYQALAETLALPDPDDRHVLAGAIVGGAAVIVTCNLRDFPPAALAPYDLEAQHPDVFLEHAYSLAPPRFVGIVAQKRRELTRPHVSVGELLELLHRTELTTLAAALVQHAEAL